MQQKYQLEKKHFIETVLYFNCSECKSPMVEIPENEQVPYTCQENKKEYVEVLKCSKCNLSKSYYTYNHWFENKKFSTKRNLSDLVIERREALKEYQYTVNRAKNKLKMEIIRIRRNRELYYKELLEIKQEEKKINELQQTGKTNL